MANVSEMKESVVAKNATTTEKKPQTISQLLASPQMKAQIQMALPKHMTADRLSRIVLTECRKVPALLQCNTASLLGAVMQAAQLGLEPGSALGHCYMLPFGNGKASDGLSNAQLIIGYRGMIDLARRSGQLVSIGAYCVHEGDEFHWELGMHPDIKHVPAPDSEENPITHVYAVAQLRDGGVQFEVMTRKAIEIVRSQSKAGSRGPWVTHFEEMAKKTVIRRLFKYLPISIEAARAVQVDEMTDRGESVEFVDGEVIDIAAMD